MAIRGIASETTIAIGHYPHRKSASSLVAHTAELKADCSSSPSSNASVDYPTKRLHVERDNQVVTVNKIIQLANLGELSSNIQMQIPKGLDIKPMGDMTNMQHNNQQTHQQMQANHQLQFSSREQNQIDSISGNSIINNLSAAPTTTNSNSSNHLNNLEDSIQKEQQETICDQTTHLYHQNEQLHLATSEKCQQKFNEPQQQQHLFSVLINNKTIKGKSVVNGYLTYGDGSLS